MSRVTKEKILVIEAQAETRSHMCAYLRQLGYRVDEAGSGVEGLSLLGGEEYGAVLYDAASEQGGGPGVPEILAEHPDVSVVVMSASPTVKGVIASLRHGAFDYIIKPFEIQELALILPRATDRSRENRRRRELYPGNFPGTGKFEAAGESERPETLGGRGVSAGG